LGAVWAAAREGVGRAGGSAGRAVAMAVEARVDLAGVGCAERWGAR
jgi:hypothetical protein